ncbi:YaiI/YqxD family protein, partial [Vibrio sp. 10N.222.55.F8]
MNIWGDIDACPKVMRKIITCMTEYIRGKYTFVANIKIFIQVLARVETADIEIVKRIEPIHLFIKVLA